MSTTTNDEHWLELITQCRSSGLSDRQWCIENGIPVSTFYYHVRALRKKACEVPEAVDAVAQKQEVVQIPFWETEQHTSDPVALPMPSICLEMQGIRMYTVLVIYRVPKIANPSQIKKAITYRSSSSYTDDKPMHQKRRIYARRCYM